MVNKESVTHFSQFISVKAKTMLGKYQAQFREKLRKLRLKQNDGFPIKNCSRPLAEKFGEPRSKALRMNE